MDEQEFAEYAAGYALNALSPADRQAFETARAAHPEWEHWIEADAATAAALADSIDPALPPLTLRSTLLSRIATMPQVPDLDAAVAAAAPSPGAERPVAAEHSRDDAVVDPAPTTSTIQAISRRNWTRGLLTLAASMVLLVSLGFGAVSLNQYINRPPEVAALQEIEAAPDAQAATAELAEGGTATAHWSESLGKAVLVSDGLPQIAEDESFELWFVRDGGAVSAGTFDPAEEGASTAVLAGAMEPGDVIAVTVEPQGGSPTGEPSTEPIVTIPTA
ncbi:anti-sigma factor [Microbacterium sp. CFBP9034]|uniref:anti-sigma factor n=1 Tax=Microbacterium sp. CFBP9034 TaxID=3096540 RepID=UPI002A6B2F3A|nr:anti-sigma factor [Microbacterium sp. CFBP9034]MDY0910805.1 anti-sigma factor [Microbacterium sp. CFBP9034]